MRNERDVQVSIRVPVELACSITERMDALRGTAVCVAAALETDREFPADDAAAALRGLARQVERLMGDLDVCAWSSATRVREVTND